MTLNSGVLNCTYLLVFLLELQAGTVQGTGGSDCGNSAGEDNSANGLLRYHGWVVEGRAEDGGAVNAEGQKKLTACERADPCRWVNSEAPRVNRAQLPPALCTTTITHNNVQFLNRRSNRASRPIPHLEPPPSPQSCPAFIVRPAPALA